MEQTDKSMRAQTSSLIWRCLGVLISLTLLGLAGGCSRPVVASVGMMDQAEARWQANSIPAYHIVVDVERPDDRRRSELTVRDSEIIEATVRWWDFERERWGESSDLNHEQAFPFTVPGLYDMVRGAIRDSGRVDVRVVMAGEPAFPYRIVMGPVWQDERPVPDTEAEVIVREFERLE